MPRPKKSSATTTKKATEPKKPRKKKVDVLSGIIETTSSDAPPKKREIVKIPDDMPEMIKCTLKKLPKFHLPLEKYQTDLKLGRYDYSASNFDGYGRSKFQVGISVLVDWEPLVEKYPKEEIVRRCIKYLFSRPMIKKVRNKDTEFYPFGQVDEDPQWYNFVNKGDDKYISVMILTDIKDCQYFHGEGFTW
jgi:hypothetical protein